MGLMRKFIGFAVVVTLANLAPKAQAFDLSEYFRFPLELNVEDPLPAGLECMGKDRQPLEVMNRAVLGWKESTRDQYTARALVKGTISNFYPDRTGHTHFGVHLDGDQRPDLEVIYNDKFGELPPLTIGMSVIACGDYITVGPKARLPSPLGAIIHWLHYNPGDRDGGRHPHGFLIINNKPYGTVANARFGRI